MAALMKLRQIMVYTHDSIGLGEDGPTHQPVEHVASLRLIPNLDVWRPADASETMVAWIAALERADGPTILALSRQNLPTVSAGIAPDMRRGAYVLADGARTHRPDPDRHRLGDQAGTRRTPGARRRRRRRACRLDALRRGLRPPGRAYREACPATCRAALAIEAGVSNFWCKYVGRDGAVIGIDRFGESAPAGQLFDFFGFTVTNVVNTVKSLL
jgi:transketolase